MTKKPTLVQLIATLFHNPDRLEGLPTTPQLLILVALNAAEAAIPGLEICQRIKMASEGSVTMGLNRLFMELKTMRKMGWVESQDGDPVAPSVYRGNYTITEAGKQAVLDFFRLFMEL